MLSKPQINYVKSLRHPRTRASTGRFVAEGTKIVQELLVSDVKIEKIFALSSWIGRFPEAGAILISEKELSILSELVSPQEVLAVAHIPAILPFRKQPLVLCLDGIRNPGNLGSLIRLADWYGLGQLILSRDSVDVWNEKVVQASMGSILRMNLIYTKLEVFLAEAGLPIYAASLHNSESLHDFKNIQPGILVIGNESEGIRHEILEMADYRLHIPRIGAVESLNVAVAAGIVLDTFIRNLK